MNQTPDLFELREPVGRQMLADLRRAMPREGCGLLFAAGSVQVWYSVANVAPEPGRFQMDPDELLNRMQWAEDHGFGLQAIVHSHVGGRPQPSRDDTAMAALYPDAYQVIAALHPLSAVWRVYRYGSGRLVPVAHRKPGSTGTPVTRDYLSR